MSTEAPLQGPTREDLEKALRSELTKQQDVVYAIIGGAAGALVAALIWAFITVVTGYQVGYVAIFVGALVGFSVRYFGAGIAQYFGLIGALMALLGCAFGNLLSQLAFAAQEESIGYFEVFGFLTFDLVKEIYVSSFSFMDIVFYAIAAFEGYRFAFRNLEEVLASAVSQGKVNPPPYASLRLPAVIAVFVLLSVTVFFAATSSTGIRTFSYESGSKRAMGAMAGGRETGPWQTWYEGGALSSDGFYNNGNPDSVWSYYTETGMLYKSGRYKNGLQEGEWITYNEDSTIAEKGSYKYGRQTGPWMFYYPGGKLMSKGSLMLDKREGEWEDYYENGQLQSKGSYVEGVQVGPWSLWFDDGTRMKESEYDGAGNERILNAWDINGKPYIVNGDGEIKNYSQEGKLLERFTMKAGIREGKYESFYAGGEKHEEGEFRNDVYYIKSWWHENGEMMVRNGTGEMETYYPDNNRSSYGKMNDGLKMDVWKTNYPMGETVMFEETYKRGKKEGPQIFYSVDGAVTIRGQLVADKREGEWTWYRDDGTVESVVTYVKDKKEGKQLFYGLYGDLLKTEVYKDGKLLETVVEL